jgi:serine/threonine protein kinase
VQVVGLKNLIPNASEDFIDLLSQCLTLDPKKRPTIQQIRQHRYFSSLSSDHVELGRIAAYVQDKKIKQLLK